MGFSSPLSYQDGYVRQLKQTPTDTAGHFTEAEFVDAIVMATGGLAHSKSEGSEGCRAASAFWHDGAENVRFVTDALVMYWSREETAAMAAQITCGHSAAQLCTLPGICDLFMEHMVGQVKGVHALIADPGTGLATPAAFEKLTKMEVKTKLVMAFVIDQITSHFADITGDYNGDADGDGDAGDADAGDGEDDGDGEDEWEGGDQGGGEDEERRDDEDEDDEDDARSEL
jgi:hypothetical protein